MRCTEGDVSEMWKEREKGNSTFDLNVVFPTPEEPMTTSLMVGIGEHSGQGSRAQPRAGNC
jgi:hypothetical protein